MAVAAKAIELGTIEGIGLELHSEIAPLEAEWCDLEQTGAGAIYQCFDWVRVALETFEKDNRPCLLVGRSENGVEFIFPMVLERDGISHVLRWVGGNHANVGGGLYSTAFLTRSHPALIKQVFRKLGKKLPAFSIAVLNNQLLTTGDHDNPLAQLPSQEAAGLFYELDLHPGMDAILARGNAKRKRKIFRRQVRISEELGGYALRTPETPEEIDTAIDNFLTQKAARFAELGVRDVFASENSQAFLRELAHAPMRNGVQPFRIYELWIDGKSRAMYGAGIFHDYCQCSVNSVTYDELSHISPGEMILYLMIEQLAGEKFQKLDLGVGDERYKRSWCQQHVYMFVNIMALSPLAVPHYGLHKLKTYAKRNIRSNASVWQRIRKLRQRFSRVKGPATSRG